MKVKETAERLYDSFEFPDGVHQISTSLRKYCAMKTVNEIRQALKTTISHLSLNDLDYEECQKDLVFWTDVKKEINLL